MPRTTQSVRSSTRRPVPVSPRSWPLTRLQLHPAAELVPAMTAAEYARFREDISQRGVLVPLEVTEAGVVLDGRHRLQAAAEQGLARVPVQVVAPADETEHILLCALERRHLSASQRAALVVELAAVQELAEQARLRQRANLRHGAAEPERASLPARGERTRELAARKGGVSARIVQDAFTVHREDAALFAQVKAGRIAVDVAARRVRQARLQATTPPALALPTGPFSLILADPPWQLGNPDSSSAPENHYPTLPLATIAALELPAAADAVLFLWAVSSLLPDALQLMQAWGFSYRSNLVWVKPSIGPGVWLRNRHELLLLGVRGKHPPAEPERRADSVLEANRGRHSEKPEQVYELIERMYPAASKLELFARKSRPGWAVWGNQLP